MAERRDYLGECNEHSVPLAQFQEQFCSRCVQPECSRSLHGTTKFDRRVASWRERLFTQVPHMSQEDPRFPLIAGKQFKMIQVVQKVPEVGSSWIEPNSLDSEGPAPAPVREVPPSPSLVTEVLTAPEPVQVPRPVVTPGPDNAAPYRLAVLNTPTQDGKMLSGAPQTAKPAPKDPWAAEPPKKATEGETIIKRGATVRLGGGSGVE